MKNITHRAKKSLGQNFLKSKSALSAIVDAGDVSTDDIILEIGPGKGALTERLLLLAGKVVAVEKDTELLEYLKEKFQTEIENGKLDLIEDDILNFDPEVFNFYKDLNYKIIANIPYNITGAILKKFLSSKIKPERMVLLVQKEVADRIVARDGKESILSLSVKAYGDVKKIIKVPKTSFSPAPKVDSAVIAIENISMKNFKDVEEGRFFEIVRIGFAHKRKILAKNLQDLENPISSNVLENLGKKRAEDIPLSEWLDMAK